METQGISVIVCCFNSSKRIRNALIALANQEFRSAIDWEILLVDNNSTDDTAAFSNNLWKTLSKDIQFRILFEPQTGLANARRRGVNEATYSTILFCDDDNWLAPDYLQTAFDI